MVACGRDGSFGLCMFHMTHCCARLYLIIGPVNCMLRRVKLVFLVQCLFDIPYMWFQLCVEKPKSKWFQ